MYLIQEEEEEAKIINIRSIQCALNTNFKKRKKNTFE